MELRTLENITNFNKSRKAAICTQIEWRGSVPRKDHPMMLVDDAGGIIGTIGGGALEHSAIQLALEIIETGTPIVKKYELSNQDVTRSDSICGGTTAILIEPFSAEIKKLFEFILADNEQNKILITKITYDPKLLIERTMHSGDNLNSFPKKIISAIQEVCKANKSKSVNYNDEMFLIQNIGTRPVLHIFGAGHVGQAVAEMAHFIELDTKIYDERDDLANRDRFPFALQINNDKTSKLSEQVGIAKSDYVLVATRGHQHDFEIMCWLLNLEIDYLSLMSSNKKWQLLSQALEEEGISQEKISAVHSPVGIDIGSETVPEIAVSIIAEIVNHYRKGVKSESSLSV